MEITLKELQDFINPTSRIPEAAPEFNFTGKTCIVRTYSAGVFVGKIVARNNGEVVLDNCVRMWKWYSGLSISEAAINGVNKTKCKFSIKTNNHLVRDVIEIIQCTPEASLSIYGVTPYIEE